MEISKGESVWRRILFFVLFALFLLTKESDLAIAGAVLLAVGWMRIKVNNMSLVRRLATCMPELVAFGYVAYRIILSAQVASSVASYDRANLDGMVQGAFWVLGSYFPIGKGFPIEPILGILALIIPMIYLWKHALRTGQKRGFALASLLFFETIFSIVPVAVSSHHDLRYAHLFCMLTAQLIALAVFQWIGSGKLKQSIQFRSAMVAMVALLWATTHYHNFVMQFALQRETGRFEQMLLQKMEATAARSHLALDLPAQDEPMAKVLIYLSLYRPWIGKPALSVGIPTDANIDFLLTRRPAYFHQWTTVETYSIQPDASALIYSAWLSAPLQVRQPEKVFTWVDGGASSFRDYPPWYLMKSNSPMSKPIERPQT